MPEMSIQIACKMWFCKRNSALQMQKLCMPIYARNQAWKAVRAETDGRNTLRQRFVAQRNRRPAGRFHTRCARLGASIRARTLRKAAATGQQRGVGDGRDVALYPKKTQKLWLWKVLDSVTGQLLEWECGDRSTATLIRLYARIKHWNVDFFCTDEFAPYAKILPKDKLVMSKALTIGIEQNNGRQRHWFKRFGRKSIVVSKSREMVDLTIFLFAAIHVNKTLTLPSLFT